MENKRLIISVGAPIIGDNVESVNGKTGVVVLYGTDIETEDSSGVTIKQGLDNLENLINTDFQSNIFVGQDAGKNNDQTSTTQGRQNTNVGANSGFLNQRGYALDNFGFGAGYNFNLDGGSGNCNIGYQSGYNNEVGVFNTNLGTDAGARNKGSQNTFIGHHSGFGFSTFATGDNNVLIGKDTGLELLTGGSNVGIGNFVFKQLTDGIGNCGFGYLTSENLIDGDYNTTFGFEAGKLNENGNNNTLFGYRSGFNITGSENIGFGSNSLQGITTGGSNIGIGATTAANVTTGGSNVFIGLSAGTNASQKTDAQWSVAIGRQAYTTKNFQIVLGNSSISETVLSTNVVLRKFSDGDGTPDVGIRTFKDGELSISDGSTGLGNLKAKVVNTEGFTVATLPTGEIGQRAYVTDATSPTFRGVVVGGGSDFTPVIFDGTNWICA